MNPSQYAHAKSDATIIVRVYIYGVAMPITEARTLDTISSSHDFYFGTDDNGYSTNDITKIAVSMSGTPSSASMDLFVLDQIELYNVVSGSYVEVWSQGVDNETGFCLSWEQGDGDNEHCYMSVASQDWEWNL